MDGLLGIHTKETIMERDTCTPMFISALFIIARTWKQPKKKKKWADGKEPDAGKDGKQEKGMI